MVNLRGFLRKRPGGAQFVYQVGLEAYVKYSGIYSCIQ
jgi:hypothetical protein